MTRNETRLTLEMKAKALKELIDDFTEQLGETITVLDSLNAQPEKGEKPIRVSVYDHQMNILGSMIALEGPLTEEPRFKETCYFRREGYFFQSSWRGLDEQRQDLDNELVYPYTPGGAAGAMLGFNPNKP